MAELTNDEIDDALARGKAAAALEPRAVSARLDGRSIIVELTNGVVVSIPHRLIQGLAGAKPVQIAEVEVQGHGYGLHWPSLDLDVSVPGLMAGVTGTRSYMAKRAGLSKSNAKAAAARKNGMKGGRPKKQLTA